MSRKLVTAAALVLATGGFALGPGARGAPAAFPGDNGRIAFAVERWRQPPSCPRDVPHACDPVQYSSTIETVLPSGRGRRVLRSFPVELGVSAPVWSPSARALAFDQGTRLATMRLDGTGWRRLPRLTSGEATPTWSPNGRRLAFTGSTICCHWLYTVRTDGTGLRRVLAREAMSPAWSVTGTIAFTSSAGLYTIRADGAGLRRLAGRSGRPDWSPDGSRIAFSRRDRIFTIGSDGRGRRRLIAGTDIASPAWSPDGRYIAFNRDGDLYVMPASGGDARRVVDARQPDLEHPERPWAQLSAPSWQPR